MGTPSGNPTLSPTPIPQTCMGLEENNVITEIVSHGNIRYVELHNLLHAELNCENARITRQMTLDLLDDNGAVIPESRIDLEGFEFSDFGFIVLCAGSETKEEYPYRCSHLVKPESAAGTDGNVSVIALQIEDEISDIFGIIGSSCNGGHNYCFTDGSAYRQKDIAQITGPLDTFNWLSNPNAPNGGSWYQWDIYQSHTRDPDPDRWILENPVPEPSSIPTTEPTISLKPSTMPSKAPTLFPKSSVMPTTTPSGNPTLSPTPIPQTCMGLEENIVITEIVSHGNIRYVELHNLLHAELNCENAKITRQMTLDLLDDNGAVIPESRIDLEGFEFSDFGFIVLCAGSETKEEYPYRCSHLVKPESAAGTDGNVSVIALQIEDEISDVYGIIGSSCNGGHNYCFTDGSAYRQKDIAQITGPLDTFNWLSNPNAPNGGSWY